MSDFDIPPLIGLDWGTSSLRAYLLGEGVEEAGLLATSQAIPFRSADRV